MVKQRRDAALNALVDSIPYIKFLGIEFDRRGDELTAIMPFKDELIGNPFLPALHGGATAAFLEMTAIIGLSWATLWEDIESGQLEAEALVAGKMPPLPKTIDFTVDYLRSGLPRDAYARAQDQPVRAALRFGACGGLARQPRRGPTHRRPAHFLMPSRDD